MKSLNFLFSPTEKLSIGSGLVGEKFRQISLAKLGEKRVLSFFLFFLSIFFAWRNGESRRNSPARIGENHLSKSGVTGTQIIFSSMCCVYSLNKEVCVVRGV
jgi:hypothetical protein